MVVETGFAEALYGDMAPALWAGLLVDMLAEEVILFNRGQRIVYVGAADKTELEWVDTQRLLVF